ncbi:hypothetical protein HQ545_00495 [Candidatus Woesearchaeota archaeon]|nr:hypothetical protein [Candidatus Woesearchaeota archaeon]
MANRETVSVRLDPKLWEAARIAAIKKKVSVGKLVEKALKRELRLKP